MGLDLIARLEAMGRPRIAVVGDLILDRYIWGDAERISQEAPVPLLRADQREHRLGGAASVAMMLQALGAEVDLRAGVGRDASAETVRGLLENLGIATEGLFTLDDRPTTLKERYIGRAQDRHPQQMMRVDYEVRDPLPADAEQTLIDGCASWAERADIVLISDYDKGVCTPRFLRALIDTCRAKGIKILADPIRSRDYSKYRGVTCMTPNRLEAQMASGGVIATPQDALDVGKSLVQSLEMDAILVTLDRDGMALSRRNGAGVLVPTRPRQVYDITGAGDMVLAMVGLCLAESDDYEEAAALGNVAGGLEVECIGVAPVSRQEILRDLLDYHQSDAAKQPDWESLVREVRCRRQAGQSIVFTNGCFDLLHVGHIRLLQAAAELGDFLIVGLNSDASVQRLKGDSRPIQSQNDRAEVLAALECVDAVSIFDEDTPLRIIESLLPDVLVKGGDYRPEEVVGREEVEAAGGRLALIPLIDGRSTTGLVQRMRIPAQTANANAGQGQGHAHADRSLIRHAAHPSRPTRHGASQSSSSSSSDSAPRSGNPG